MNRRQSIRLIGGGVVVAASAITGFALTRKPNAALEPWTNAGEYEDIRRFSLSYAVLVPNPHNRQPWLAELVGERDLNIYRDLSKNLPETDPFDRQLTIGMGCFLEGIDIAADRRGFETETTLFPNNDEHHIAHIRFKKSKGTSSHAHLFAAFLTRHSCKEPFSDKPLSAAHAEALAKFGEVFTDEQDVEKLRRLSWDAYQIEHRTHHKLKESVDLMRIGKKQINANPDGIDMGGPIMEALALAGTLTPEKLLDPESTIHQQGLEMYDRILNSTPAYILLKTPHKDREQQIATGRRWLQLNLTTTQLGVSLHPVSQALQEYAEMSSVYEAIHKGFAEEGETIQMFGRLGYGPRVSPSPRWPVEKKLI